jgi:ADP-ribose pyrophosphatase YjhB (NUDIX family)
VAYHKGTHTTKIVLIKEFRSPVNNPEGFVYELPGGSAIKPGINPQVNAQHELEEEIGLMVEDLNRFSPVGDRQLMATVSSHKAQVYKIELTEAEITSLEKQEANNATYGVEEDSEKTYVKIISLDNIFSYHLDYSMLGMIFEALN